MSAVEEHSPTQEQLLSPPPPPPLFDPCTLEYVHPVDDHLSCPICHNPFFDPVQLPCDHTFCRTCIEQTFSCSGASASCPTCRASYDRASVGRQFRPVPRFVTQLLNELLVKCPNREHGCEDEIVRGDLSAHVSKYCRFTLVSCPVAEGCAKLVPRQRADPEECLHVEIGCVRCSASVEKLSMEVWYFEITTTTALAQDTLIIPWYDCWLLCLPESFS